jgi:hypothetical protein
MPENFLLDEVLDETPRKLENLNDLSTRRKSQNKSDSDDETITQREASLKSASPSETKENVTNVEEFSSVGDDDFENSTDLNIGKTITIEQEEHLDQQPENTNKILKRTVMTILLTQHLQKINKNKKNQKARKNKKMVRLQPTYRMEPAINIKSIKNNVIKKIKQTFYSLIEKHKSYDNEYTPRFLRIVTEMIKNDAKTFNLERYKIITHVTILQKVMGQSIQIISKMIASKKEDEIFCLQKESRTFYAICLLVFIYFE